MVDLQGIYLYSICIYLYSICVYLYSICIYLYNLGDVQFSEHLMVIITNFKIIFYTIICFVLG